MKTGFLNTRRVLAAVRFFAALVPVLAFSGCFNGEMNWTRIDGLAMDPQPTPSGIPVPGVAPVVLGVFDRTSPARTASWSWGCSSGNCVYRFVIDQSPGTAPDGAYTSATTASQVSGDGVYYLHIQAKDAAGTESEVMHVSVTLDNTPPAAPTQVVLVSPATSPGIDPAPTIRVGPKSPEDHVELHEDANCTSLKAVGFGGAGTMDLVSSNLSDGVHTFFARTVDSLGNASPCSTASATYVLDRSNLFVTGLADDATPVKSKSWTWGCSKTDCTYRFLVDQDANTSPANEYGVVSTASQSTGTGTYYLHVQAKDAAGNESSVVHVAANLDNTAPAKPSGLALADSLQSPGNDATPSVTVTGVSDGDTVVLYSDSTCAAIYYRGQAVAAAGSVTVTPTELSDGNYAFYALAVDSAGNESPCSTASVAYVLDTAAPSVTGLSNDAVAAKSKTWSWGCSEAGCSYSFVVDTEAGTAPAAAFDPVTTTSQSSGTGTYFLHIQAKDAAGNVSAVYHFSAVLDNTGPSAPTGLALSLPLSSPGNIKEPVVKVSGVSPGDLVRLYSGTGCAVELGENEAVDTSVELSSIILGDGSYTFYAKSLDQLGNESECSTASVSYVLDTSAVTVTGLSDDSTPTPIKTWSWGCSKASCKYRYLIDDTAASEPSGALSAASTSATQATGNGLYYLHVQAQDEAGNLSSVVTVSATIDNTSPPAPVSLTLLDPAVSPGMDPTPTIRVNGVTAGDTVQLHSNAACSSLVASGTATGGFVDLTSSELPEGDYNFYARAIDAAGNASSCSVQTVSYSFKALVCPENFIRVPGNASYSIGDFCVAKYEMKALSGTLLVNDGAVTYNPVYTASSRPDGTPWVNITQGNAAQKCRDLGVGYELISNAQWQTIARNLVDVGANWNNGIVNRGHSDNSSGTFATTQALQSYASNAAPALVDADPFYGTGQSDATGWEQRRTHFLNNGEVIWDLAGNVWEWVADAAPASFGGSSYISMITHETHPVVGTIGLLGGDAKFHFGPLADFSSYNSSPYGGLGYAGIGATNGAIVRGGNWANQTGTGIFAVDLTAIPTNAYNGIGFRCSWTPSPPAPSLIALSEPSTSPNTIQSPGILVGGVSAGYVVGLYTSPNCDAATLVASDVASGATIELWPNLPGKGIYDFYADSTFGGRHSDCSKVNVRYEFTDALTLCPENFIHVQGNPDFGTGDFCVAKFPMKAVVPGTGELYGTGNGSGSWLNDTCYDEYGEPYACSLNVPIPVADADAASRPDGSPWVNISRDEAVQKCSAMDPSYHLITNAEWQTIARAIEATPLNWSGGVVGAGMINRGHSDAAIASDAIVNRLAFTLDHLGLASSSSNVVFNDAQGYLGTGNSAAQGAGSGWEQKRTHTLPDGGVIWDLSGNLLQWVSDSVLSGPVGSNAYISAITPATHNTSATLNSLSGTAKFLFGPAGTYGANPYRAGLGFLNSGSGSVARGGAYSSGDFAGVFGAVLALSPSSRYVGVAFRCVAPSQ